MESPPPEPSAAGAALTSMATAPSRRERLQAQLSELLAFADACRWIWDCHLLDCLREGQPWRTAAPEGWIDALANASAAELMQALLLPPPPQQADGEEGGAAAAAAAVERSGGLFDGAAPESLCAWFAQAHALTAPFRAACAGGASLSSAAAKAGAPEWLVRAIADSSEADRGAAAAPAATAGVKAKKAAELAAVGALVAAAATAARADAVVDCGAGKGHLAALLARRWGLNVVAVEGNAQLAAAAAASAAGAGSSSSGGGGGGGDNNARRTEAKDGGTGCVVSVALRLDPATMPEQLPAAVERAWRRVRADPNRVDGHSSPRDHPPALRRLLLVGLHACGDLTPALLRTYAAWPAAAGLVSVGCCYNLLTEPGAPPPVLQLKPEVSAPSASSELGAGQSLAAAAAAPAGADSRCGWPMSKFLRERHPHCSDETEDGGSSGLEAAASSVTQRAWAALGRHGRMAACQSAKSSLDGCSPAALAETLRQHSLRAALQAYLAREHAGDVDVDGGGASLGRLRKRNKARRAGTAASSGPAAESTPAASVSASADGAGSCSIADACAPSAEDFAAYALAALAQLGLPAPPGDGDGADALAGFWRGAIAADLRIVPALWTLRLAAAPVLEAAILLDRALYLEEQREERQQQEQHHEEQQQQEQQQDQQREDDRAAVVVLPLFDPRVSPRNAAIVALKEIAPP